MRFKQGYKVTIKDNSIQLVYFMSINAFNALEAIKAMEFKTVDDLRRWLNNYGKDECGKFIWLAIDQK
jgi:hypothetical protein